MLSFPHCPGSDLPPYWIPISLGSDYMPHLPLSIDPCPTTCPSIAEVSYLRVLFASTLTSSRYVIRMQKCNRTNLGKSPSKLFFPQYFLLSTVNLQCCVNLCCTACGLVMHVYDVLVFYSFPLWFIIEYWIKLSVPYRFLFTHSMYKSLHWPAPTSHSRPSLWASPSH